MNKNSPEEKEISRMYQCRALSKLSKVHYQIMHRALKLRPGAWDLTDRDDICTGQIPICGSEFQFTMHGYACLILAEFERSLIMAQRDAYRASSRHETRSLEKSPCGYVGARNYRPVDFRNLFGGLFYRSYRTVGRVYLGRLKRSARRPVRSDLICRFDRSRLLIDDIGDAIGFLMNVQRNVTNSAVKAPAISSCHCDISHVSPHEETYARACTATLKAYLGLPRHRRVWPFKRARCANDAGNERDATRSRDCPLLRDPRESASEFSSLLLRRCSDCFTGELRSMPRNRYWEDRIRSDSRSPASEYAAVLRGRSMPRRQLVDRPRRAFDGKSANDQ